MTAVMPAATSSTRIIGLVNWSSSRCQDGRFAFSTSSFGPNEARRDVASAASEPSDGAGAEVRSHLCRRQPPRCLHQRARLDRLAHGLTGRHTTRRDAAGGPGGASCMQVSVEAGRLGLGPEL